MHLLPIHVGLEISCVGSIYTREIGKGHKSIPFLFFFRDLAVTHLSGLHWKWSLKKPGVVSVVRKIKAWTIWRAEKTLFITEYSRGEGVATWPNFLQQDALQIPSKPSLDGCSQKQKWWEAILGKVPNSMLNWTVNQCVSCWDDISQWCHLVLKYRLAPKRDA